MCGVTRCVRADTGNGRSVRRSLAHDMHDLARPGLLNGCSKLRRQRFVIDQLVLGNHNHDHTQPELLQVLLELQAAIDGDEDVETILRQQKQGSVCELIPAHIMDRLDFMIQKEFFHSRVYALINEDAHSMS